MDLKERHHENGSRHPWELARVKALREIALASGVLAPEVKVLDLGCGDGFLIDGLCPLSVGTVDDVDIHLTADQVATFAAERPRINFHNSERALVEHSYGLITMFDVLEHIEDDALFLRQTISRFAAPGASFFCTVPAFQALYSSHDSFLQHRRRYNLPRLMQLLEKAGLECVCSGYLFSLLLPVRAVAVLAEHLLGMVDPNPGIGHWQHGRLLTALVSKILEVDNLLLLCLGRMGIKIPGLAVWAICKTPR